MASDPTRPALRDFQTWMQTFIVSPGTPQQALSAAEHLSGLTSGSAQRLVKPSHSLDEMERLMIYRRMYLLRMEEALSIDFPATRELLGPKTFFGLVADYVEAHPSRSWTLDHLGQHMVGFVADHRLTADHPGLPDLVILEQALCEVFNAEDATVLTAQGLSEIDPEMWLEARFECSPALRLLPLQSNANALYKAHVEESEFPPYQAGNYPLVVWRQAFSTWRMPLEAPAFAMLSRLQAGETLAESLGYALDHYSLDEGKVFTWFQTWVAEGFFRKLVITDPESAIPLADNLHPI